MAHIRLANFSYTDGKKKKKQNKRKQNKTKQNKTTTTKNIRILVVYLSTAI